MSKEINWAQKDKLCMLFNLWILELYFLFSMLNLDYVWKAGN